LRRVFLICALVLDCKISGWFNQVTLRLVKIFLPVLPVALFVFGSVAHAQENVIEVEVGSLQTETMRKFLQEHRLELRKSNLDLSAIVEEVRDDFRNLKQEQKRTLQVSKKFKTPVLIKRKTFPGKKELLRQPESVLENFFPDKKNFESEKPGSQEKRLNLKERQRRADIEIANRAKFRRAQNTELGKLKAEIKREPLKSYQAQLTLFSEKIRNLLEQLQEEEGVQRTVFLDLGNTYFESHQFLDSLSAKDRWKLTKYADHSGIILGSHESALWVYKMALVRNPNDGETNFRAGKILSEMGEQDLALRRVRNAEVLFEQNSQPDRAVEALDFIEALKSSSSE
jgi:hypothetical protein